MLLGYNNIPRAAQKFKEFLIHSESVDSSESQTLIYFVNCRSTYCEKFLSSTMIESLWQLRN